MLFNLANKRKVQSVFSSLLVLTLVFTDFFAVLEHGLFRAPEVEAAVGDFSVFREAAGGDVLTTSLGASFDTVVTESANIQLDANDTDIDLAEGGKYLVLYNVYTEEGSQGGANRRSVASYLTLDGSTIPYGFGAGYIRDQEDQLTAYNSGAAIIDASAGQDLRVVLERDDSNPGGGTEVRDGTNGISVLKLDDDLDYLRIHKSTRSSDISGNTTFTDVTFDTLDEVDTDAFEFSPTSADVTVKGPVDQMFLVTANVKLNVDGGGGPRQNYEMRLTLDDAEVEGTRTSTYLRFDQGTVNGTMQYVGIIKKTSAADQTFNIEVRREGPEFASTDIVGDETALSMVALPTSAGVLSLTNTANQPLTSAESVMNWNTQINTAPTYFNHSTLTANDEIEINVDGNYLFFSTTYTSRTSGTGRDVPKLDWRLDGTVLSYGGHASFNRGDQSTDDTFTSGNSGGTIIGSLTSGQIIDLVQSDETSGTPVADFIGNRVALQAVEISTLLDPSTTDISIIGNQPATSSPAVTDFVLGEQIVVVENIASRNLTNISLSEDGTIDAASDLGNIRLFYDLDTSAPYNCASESYNGTESQFGGSATFSGANGTVNFSSSETISPTQAFCGYVVLDIGSGASNGESINIFIDDPSTDVVVTGGGTVNPPSSIGNSQTIIENAELTQANYHWRNDDGSETGATSATGGIENTPGLSFSTTTPQRLRLGINADGTGTEALSYRLEYGEKFTTCEDVSVWSDVGAAGGAWDMFNSPNITDGANTTNISVATGGVSDGTGSLVSGNGGLKDTSSETSPISITANDFVELEYSVIATNSAVEGVAYCFRVADASVPPLFLAGYDSRVSFTVPAANVDENLTDFPVYIDLADLGADFWSGVASDGSDIRVTTSNGLDEVPYELVDIDDGAETGELYFKAPALSASVDSDFYIYFASTTASAYGVTDTFGRNNVWTNAFEAVYHLEEDPSGAGPQMVDSTGNNRDLTAEGSMTSGDVVAGQIGQAIDFDGVNDALRNAAWSWSGDAVTVSYWNNVTSAEVKTNLTFGFNPSGSERFSTHSPWSDSTLYWDYGTCCGGGRVQTSYVSSLNKWTHVSLVSGGSANSFMGAYLDGSEAISKFSSEPPSVTLSNFDLGNGDFDGRIDEFRIASTLRSSGWISTAYENQNNPGGFSSVGSLETKIDNVFQKISYDIYPEATLSADVAVSALGSQIGSVDAGDTDFYVGGSFVFTSSAGARTINSITFTETGTVDAAADLSNPTVAIEFDTSAPYNCVSESYGGGETTLTGSAFVSENGTTTFAGSALINATRALCVYVLVDVGSGAEDGETINFEITAPNNDVGVVSGTVGPGSIVDLAGSTNINAPNLTQNGFHWRNDNGNESGATSATGGVENTVLENVRQNSTQRLRIAASNEGTSDSVGTDLRLEYGVKVFTCNGVSNWERVDTGMAFSMASTSELVEGDDTSDLAIPNGGITNQNPTRITANSGQKEDDDQVATVNISTSQYIELEFALLVTDEAAFGANYCFRLTDAGVPLPTYTNYPEFITQERQDFFVQRGTETVSGTGLTLTAGVDYIAPLSSERAFIRITNTSMTGAGSDTLGSDASSPDDITAYLENPENIMDSVIIRRPPTAVGNTRVSWEIIEYIGIPGADNEMVVRGVGSVTYGANSLSATGTAVTGIADDADVAVFITGQLNPSSATGDHNTVLSIASWAGGSDQPVFERGEASGVAAGVSYAVVEYTGANWNVQRVEHVFTETEVIETQPITAVNSLARTFLQAQKTAGFDSPNLDDIGHEVWLSSIGAVSFRLERTVGSPELQKSVAWIVENTQTGDGAMEVYRSNGQIATGGTQPGAYIFSIGATINPLSSSIWTNNLSTGEGNAHPRAFLGARIINADQYELWKSDEAQNQSFRTEIVDFPTAETSVRQTDYRFYVDNDALTPVDAWPPGLADLGENEAMTDIDEPLGIGERVRIRTSLFINNASLVAGSQSFKLQYSRRVTTCSAASVWDDVGQPGSGEVWRGFDAGPADGAELSSTLISVSDIAGSYEESNPSVPNPNTVDIAEYVEYDWLIENNGALQKSSYCFRIVENNGEVLDGYDVFPTVRTSGYTPVINNWRWYTDENNVTPSSALGGERVSPSDVPLNEVLKLRVSVTEVEGASGDNIKFNLQYSERSDFSDGGTTLTATTTCSGNSLWCYADAAGDDNDIIDTAVLSGVAACTGGVGIGCGTLNEAEGLFGVYDQPAFSTSEHEFTLRHDGARVNAVYYFRLVDATNGVNLLASSSFPSLVTEGASLTLQVNGVDSGTTLEGVTTDATSTATGINFGSLPTDTNVEVAQQLVVLTNGTNGYQVYMQFDQELLNDYGDSIPSVAATNAAPATWESLCTGVTTGCFGYHAGDNVLYDGSTRFSLDNRFAGVEAGAVEIMASNIPVTFDVSNVVFRTSISYLQPAGRYRTSVQYIAVPIY